MPDICTRICAAGRTVTALLNRTHILLILLVEQIKLAVIRVYMSVTAVSAWVYTVKEVDSSLYTLKYIGRSSYSHQVCRFINRQMRHSFIKNMVHLLMALSYRQSSDSISVQLKLRNALCMVNSYIIINSSLVDTE